MHINILIMFLISATTVALGRPPLPSYDPELKISPAPGSPWPMPATYKTTGTVYPLDWLTFRFKATGQTCDILTSAFTRYNNIIFGSGHPHESAKNLKYESTFRNRRGVSYKVTGPVISHIDVSVDTACAGVSTSINMIESYTLDVSASGATLRAREVWGALRGLETFSQLVTLTTDMGLVVNDTHIEDSPRFAWRGILLDTSRHYLPVSVLLENLDAMAYNKINVFHWHIVDDQSFPYVSRDFPAMSEQGAYDPYTHIYTQSDVQLIIDYARLLGIRVVPEFDSPGHSRSWGNGIAGLLTPCYDSAGKFDGSYGPIDPTVNGTYMFLKLFVKELTEVFKDQYLHLGGDEVSFNCWKSNPNITAFMQAKGYGTDYTKLESYYIQQLLDIVSSYSAKYIVWQEVFDNHVQVKPDTVIEVWKGGWQKEMLAVTQAGLTAILSSPWYLDYISYGPDWNTYYMVEPTNFNGTAQQQALVIGGEACLWAEYVDATNVVPRLWPRASAVAERLWSPAGVNNLGEARPRMEEHRCRLIRRGIYAEPANGPGFCDIEAGL